ncbi:MAG: septal ring lytic transglycosylase RlpA family protein, partial [Bacteroidales bacterium]|nr:septal ring lytic transglycosylase RlpA family protein [Bacteroidales bacterium]
MFGRQIFLPIFLIIFLSLHSFVVSQIAYNERELDRIYYGKSSFYGDEFIGNHTANGEIYVHNKMTAAHRLWPFNTQVKVTNLNNRRSVIVRINDRGPFIEGRHLDVSKGVAEALGFVRAGVVDVRMEIISWGKDDPEQMERLANAEKALLLSDRSINSAPKPLIAAGSSTPKQKAEPLKKEIKSVAEVKP